MAFALRCPDCRGKFPWTVNKRYPRHCPLCDADLGEPVADDVISIPAFWSAKSKSVDNVYRDIERSSEVRMEKAAEMTGLPVSDFNDLKVTNLRPTKHQGDIAVAPVVNDVTRQMDLIKANGGMAGWQGANAVEYSQAVQTGPHPNMGAKMRSALQRANGMISDRPAIETTQPGYRVRG